MQTTWTDYCHRVKFWWMKSKHLSQKPKCTLKVQRMLTMRYLHLWQMVLFYYTTNNSVMCSLPCTYKHTTIDRLDKDATWIGIRSQIFGQAMQTREKYSVSWQVQALCEKNHDSGQFIKLPRKVWNENNSLPAPSRKNFHAKLY